MPLSHEDDGVDGRDWRRHVFRRATTVRTTWRFRLACVAVIALLAYATETVWARALNRSLYCEEHASRADAILVENFDVDYLPFERAAELQRDGVSDKVVIPIAVRENGQSTSVAEGIVDLMTRISRMRNWRTIPVREVEPISLNTARQVKDFLEAEHVHSVVVVAPGLRSRRSLLVYQAVLPKAGIAVSCVPTRAERPDETWTRSWHGIQDVAMQLVKLEYYRLWVLPKASRFGSTDVAGRSDE